MTSQKAGALFLLLAATSVAAEAAEARASLQAGWVIPPDEAAQERQAEDSADRLDSNVKTNVPMIIKSFIAARSPQGYWPFREKKSERLWRLRLISVDVNTLRRVGPDRYAASTGLHDIEGSSALKVDFIVDLSGHHWKVVGMVVKERRA